LELQQLSADSEQKDFLQRRIFCRVIDTSHCGRSVKFATIGLRSRTTFLQFPLGRARPVYLYVQLLLPWLERGFFRTTRINVYI